jgi:hypothetical protein
MEGEAAEPVATMDKLATMINKAKHTYQAGGLLSLLRRGFRFLVYCLFEYRSYWLYADPTPNGPSLNEADFMPRIDDFTFRIITSNQEVDEMEAQGFEFRSQVPKAAERLDKGAVAFCILVGTELAHIVWFAMNREAKDAFNEPPYTIDFSKGEVCSAAAWTHPKYRGMGLNRYSHFKRGQFKAAKGISTSKSAIAKDNIAMQRSYAGPMPNKYAEGRYLRILRWKSCREKPLTPEGEEGEGNALG